MNEPEPTDIGPESEDVEGPGAVSGRTDSPDADEVEGQGSLRGSVAEDAEDVEGHMPRIGHGGWDPRNSEPEPPARS
jgi:hypothetical protein